MDRAQKHWKLIVIHSTYFKIFHTHKNTHNTYIAKLFLVVIDLL